MAMLWKLYYKTIYGAKLQLGKNFQFRRGLSLLLDGQGGKNWKQCVLQ